MSPAPEAARLSQLLHLFRRRLRRTLALQLLWPAVGAAIVVAEAVALMLGAGVTQFFLLLGVTTAAAALLVAGITALRAPSLPDAARLLDRREALQDRASTALQFSGCGDAVSALIVRDAAQRISGLDPAAVFPNEPPPHPWVLVATVTVSSLVFSFAVTRSASVFPTETLGRRGIAIPGGSAQTPQSANRLGDAPVAQASPDGRLTPIPDAPAPRTVDRAAVMASNPEPAGPASANAPVQSPSSSQTSQHRADPNRADATAMARSDSRDRAIATTARGAARASSGQAAGDARGAAGAGGATPGRSARSGGGVQEGALDPQLPARAGDGLASAAPKHYADEHGAAWSRAQAAIAQDRVPPELREYVRRYFAAIRTPKQP